MNLPFTPEQFLQVFVRYNQAIWPLQGVAYLLGAAAVWLAFQNTRTADRAISGILAVFWVWMGLVYHLAFFRQINQAAALFGLLFVVQALVLLFVGVLHQRLSFRVGSGPLTPLGGLLVLYAMVVYPILGALLGHGYPAAPMFGVAPCPTTIFTFGLLLWTDSRVPWYVWSIPLAWSVVGFGAALSLGIREDFGLLVAGLLGTALLLWRDHGLALPGRSRQRYV